MNLILRKYVQHLQASSSEAPYFLVLPEPLKTLFLYPVSLSFFISLILSKVGRGHGSFCQDCLKSLNPSLCTANLALSSHHIVLV